VLTEEIAWLLTKLTNILCFTLTC